MLTPKSRDIILSLLQQRKDSLTVLLKEIGEDVYSPFSGMDRVVESLRSKLQGVIIAESEIRELDQGWKESTEPVITD